MTTAPEVEPLSNRVVWWRAYRHHLRLLCAEAVAWIVVIAGVGMLTALGYQDIYPTGRSPVGRGEPRGGPRLRSVVRAHRRVGDPGGLHTLALERLCRAGGGMLAAGKLLRGAEESGHVEPLRAGAISQRGLLAAALAALVTVFALLAVAVGLTHTAAGMDAATSWTYGGTLALIAATFAAVSAFAAQIVDSRRRATSIVGAAIGITLGVRILAAGTGT